MTVTRLTIKKKKRNKSISLACRYEVFHRFVEINSSSSGTTFIGLTVNFRSIFFVGDNKRRLNFSPYAVWNERNRFNFALSHVIWINSWALSGVLCGARQRIFPYECFFVRTVRNVKQLWTAGHGFRVSETVYRDATLCTVNHGYHWSNREAVQAASKRWSRVRATREFRLQSQWFVPFPSSFHWLSATWRPTNSGVLVTYC